MDIVLIVILTVLLVAMSVTAIWLLVLPIGFFDDEPGHKSREENRKDDI